MHRKLFLDRLVQCFIQTTLSLQIGNSILRPLPNCLTFRVFPLEEEGGEQGPNQEIGPGQEPIEGQACSDIDDSRSKGRLEDGSSSCSDQ